MLISILALSALALVFGLLLGYADIRFKVEGDPIIEQVEALLPQTQCGQCGFAGCRPYAEALAGGDAEINLCPPGGELVMLALAEVLGRDPTPMDEAPASNEKGIALIEEQECIGCTKCIQMCPVDAIIGGPKAIHTVLRVECTGCGKCVEPCPVSCITMVPQSVTVREWKWPFPAAEAAA